MREIESINIKIPGITSSLLLVAFVVLKLCNVITWSWWWVLSPLWIPIAFVILILLIGLFIYGLILIFK